MEGFDAGHSTRSISTRLESLRKREYPLQHVAPADLELNKQIRDEIEKVELVVRDTYMDECSKRDPTFFPERFAQSLYEVTRTLLPESRMLIQESFAFIMDDSRYWGYCSNLCESFHQYLTKLCPKKLDFILSYESRIINSCCAWTVGFYIWIAIVARHFGITLDIHALEDLAVTSASRDNTRRRRRNMYISRRRKARRMNVE